MPERLNLFLMFWTGIFSDKRVIFSATGLMPISKRLNFLKDLLLLFKAGKIKTVIDRSYRLDQIIEAHKYVEQGHIKGNVVITVEHNNKI